MEFLEQLKEFYNGKLESNPMETLQKYVLPLEFLHEASDYRLKMWSKIGIAMIKQGLPKVRSVMVERNLKAICQVLDFRKSSVVLDFSLMREIV